MIPAIRSELRKLLTVRSTYFILAFCLAITVLFAFYIEGYRSTANVTDPDKLASEAISAAQSLGLFISLAGVLLVTHEYRYNTIMYTLTLAKDRTKVLLAKIVVISVFAVVVTLCAAALSVALTYLGLHAKGLTLVPQTMQYGDLIWRIAFYGWAYAMIALLIATVVRNQVGTIAILFLFPSLAESLLGLLLKNNAIYLPFTALSQILQVDGTRTPNITNALSHSQAAEVVVCYLIGGWLIAWLLFLRRDAN